MPGIAGLLLLAITKILKWNLDPSTVKLTNLLAAEKSKDAPGKEGKVLSDNRLQSDKAVVKSP